MSRPDPASRDCSEFREFAGSPHTSASNRGSLSAHYLSSRINPILPRRESTTSTILSCMSCLISIPERLTAHFSETCSSLRRVGALRSGIASRRSRRSRIRAICRKDMLRKLLVGLSTTFVCCVAAGCFHRVVGYRLQGPRVGWCNAADLLVLDSQDLAGVLVQRCVSPPLLPVSIFCEPWSGMASSVGFRNLTHEGLVVHIDRFELVRADKTRPLAAEYEKTEYSSRSSAKTPSAAGTTMEIEFGPGGAVLIVLRFATQDVAAGSRLVVAGRVETSSGRQESFQCNGSLVPRSGEWKWLNPFVTED